MEWYAKDMISSIMLPCIDRETSDGIASATPSISLKSQLSRERTRRDVECRLRSRKMLMEDVFSESVVRLGRIEVMSWIASFSALIWSAQTLMLAKLLVCRTWRCR